MAYNPTTWENREVERPRTFRMVENQDGTVTLIPEEGEIYNEGTKVNAATMNNMEQGIVEALTEASNSVKSVNDKKGFVTLTAGDIAETATRKYMTGTERDKLAGVAVGANNYTHPATHPPSIILQDTNNRFMTDAERNKLAGIAVGANNYVHPSTHPATIITESANKRFMTDAERAKLANLSSSDTFEVIESVNITSDTNAVSFNNLPSGFSYFQILYNVTSRSDDSSYARSMYLEIMSNYPDTSNYYYRYISSGGSSGLSIVNSRNEGTSSFSFNNVIPRGYYTSGYIYIVRNSIVAFYDSVDSSTFGYLAGRRGQNPNTYPTTSIRVTGGFGNGSSFKLLGVK